MKRFPRFLFACLLATLWAGTVLVQGDERPTYKSGYSSIMKLGRDIYGALKANYREQISVQPIAVESEPLPFVRLMSIPDEPKPVRGVAISEGFIDLVNQVAHATAIDLKRRGYLARLVQTLAVHSGDRELAALPDDENPAFWNDDMLNEQLSNFNSIVGIVVGIKLAHHYLGHFDRYQDRLVTAEGKTVPINNLLKPAEWEEAFRLGVRNALGAGCTVEGGIPFFEALGKMKPRPAWAGYFVPAYADTGKFKRQLEKIQEEFFNE